jgi:hypothetical protein
VLQPAPSIKHFRHFFHGCNRSHVLFRNDSINLDRSTSKNVTVRTHFCHSRSSEAGGGIKRFLLSMIVA